MSKFLGLDPKPKTVKIAEEFENKVIIRRNNMSLIGRVYVDIMDNEWKVAMGYNQTKTPKLYAKENSFEVIYQYQPGLQSPVFRLGTDNGQEDTFSKEPFSSPDEFVTWAIGQEKDIQMSPA